MSLYIKIAWCSVRHILNDKNMLDPVPPYILPPLSILTPSH